MINKQDGGVCGVDLASVFEYGLKEFVPARLTANLLAVCDVKGKGSVGFSSSNILP